LGKTITIGQLAELKGVTVDTIRRWEKDGKIKSVRTDGGHRRYDLADFAESKVGITIAYARVSSNDQKADLERQCLTLSAHCESMGWEYKLVQDLGSGMNYRKKGLKKLIEAILEGDISRLVISHKDRLLRFGSELIFSICEHQGIEVVILNKSDDATFEEDLATDVLEIITVFSARLYGSRSHKNKKLLENLAKSVDLS
jgi:putative resolvase